VIPSLDCHILLPLNKSIMSMLSITLGGLENRCFNLNIFDKDLANLTYSGLSSHLKKNRESHFSDVSQVTLNCESRAKVSRNFPRSSEKPRNECHVNMVEYSSESSDDKEADMCVAEWS
jgi:hypothetical protein